MVEIVHPFDDFDEKREFNKLVRDKIPSNIESGGEIVSKTSLTGEFLSRALCEKLVEESFEVLDAIDQDSILDELADVNEVIDGILSHLGLDRGDLQKNQDKKREKAGGFKEGLVLLETKNPLPTEKQTERKYTLFDHLNNIPHSERKGIFVSAGEVIELGHSLDKWTDRRKHPAATEAILNIVVPMVVDNWAAKTSETIIETDSDGFVQVKIKGTRSGAKLKIDLSLYISQKQLKLF